MNPHERFRGTGVALVTPFKNNGSIDWEDLEKIIEHVTAGGVEFLVSLGTTGAMTLVLGNIRIVAGAARDSDALTCPDPILTGSR